MASRTIVILLLALVCGGAAAVGVSQLKPQSGSASSAETVPVVTAVASVPRGGMLAESMVEVRQWPKGALPPGVFANSKDVTGRCVLVPLVQGEPVLEAKLASKDSGRGMAAMIPPGMRAFTIQTDHVAAGVGGFILPGDKVDILMTSTTSGRDDQTGGGVTTTLLQSIEILAIDELLDAPDGNHVESLKSVTMLVTPNQATKLDLAMNKGVLHLALRNPEDTEEADTRPATMNDLRYSQEAPLQDLAATMSQKAGRFATSIMGAMAAARSGMPSEEGVAEEVVMKPALQPEYAEIRTYRGARSGSVRVEVWE